MTTEIAKIIPDGAQTIALTAKGQMVLRTVGEAAGFAQLMGMSGMLPPKMSPPSATVAIIAGASVGLNPFESVQSIAVINGRPSLFGDGMKAVVQGSGVWVNEKVEKYKAADGHVAAVRVSVWRKGNADPIIGEFSEKMARQAGLWGKQGPWQQYPERMLLARARAFAYRDGFADVLKGVRSAEEEQDIILAETSSASTTARPDGSPRRRASASEILAQADGTGKAAPAPAGTGEAAPAPSVPPAPENAATGAPAGGNPPPAPPATDTPATEPATPAETPIEGDADWLE